MIVYMKRNDLEPPVTVTLTDGAGTVIPLTVDDTVRFKMRVQSGETVIDEPATVLDADEGLVSYEWQDGDTDTSGAYKAEFEVTRDSRPTSFPNDDYLRVRIIDDIADPEP